MSYTNNMRELREKRRFKKFVYSRTMYTFLFVILLFVAQATWNVYEKYQETKENRQHVEEKLIKLQKRESEVKNRTQHLRSREGVEREIREKFGFVKEGEGVIIFVEPPQSQKKSLIPKSSMWGNIFEIFKDIFR